MRIGLLSVFFSVAVLGCSSKTIVPVSGQVFWENQPLEGAHVSFQPVATEENPNPGPGSYGKTDKDGRYTLKLETDDTPGARIGKHRVRITIMEEENSRSDAGPGIKSMLPERYNSKTDLFFEVPEEGTREAIFKLNP